MARISDYNQMQRLAEFGLRIQTIYRDGRHMVERNSDGSRNDNVEHGIRLCKNYWKGNKLLYRALGFDPSISYTYVVSGHDDDLLTCPNCGAQFRENEAFEACPFCGTFWNIDYDRKLLGAREHYNLLLKNGLYRFIALVLALVTGIPAAILLMRSISRTWNAFDQLKTAALALGFVALAFLFFYFVDAKLILGPLRRQKERQNAREAAFWADLAREDCDKTRFFNNLNFELARLFYGQTPDIIDYDILDYEDFTRLQSANELMVRVRLRLRTIHYRKGRIEANLRSESYTLRYNPEHAELAQLDGDATVIACRGCGASIDVLSGRCSSCGRPNLSYQAWYLVDGAKA